MKDNLLVQRVSNRLSMRNVSPDIIQNASNLIREAILELQFQDVLPPKTMDLLVGDYKEEKRDASGELLFNYIKLPSDFRKLDELYINNDSTYEETRYENYLEYLSTNRIKAENYPYARNLFTIKDFNIDEDSISQPILAMFPFPKDTDAIRISYHIDASEDSFHLFDEKYHPLILTKVESIVGLRNPNDVESHINDLVGMWRNRKGKNVANKTMAKTRPSFFGK